MGLRAADDAGTECPPGLGCEWVPAPYEDLGDGDYGNYDKANRPTDQKIDTIVIHDTEGSWDTALKLVQDPTYLAWHYTVRSSDGHIAQHVRTQDVGWHAGNWYTNAKSIGIEHEGFLTDPGTWYTEAMYRSSAQLVKYLAHEVRHPAGPAAHPRPRQRARADRRGTSPACTPTRARTGTGATTWRCWARRSGRPPGAGAAR